MTTIHTYVRCGNKIYVGDAADQWRELHSFETEKRAKRWQRDQEKQRPGSVSVGAPPVQVTRAKIDRMKIEYNRRREIQKLVREQEVDRRRNDYHVAGHGTPGWSKKQKEADNQALDRFYLKNQSYVAPDRDASSFLRERSKKRVTSRNARNTRATYGGS